MQSRKEGTPDTGDLVEVAVVSAAATDLGVALAVLRQANARRGALGHVTWTNEDLEAAVDGALQAGALYLARRAGVVAAVFILQWADPPFWGERPPDAGYVHKLAVADSATGGGVGRQLLRWAEARVRAEGRQFVRLDCDADNTRINRYYEEAGFVRAGYRTSADGYRWSLFEKELASPQDAIAGMRPAAT